MDAHPKFLPFGILVSISLFTHSLPCLRILVGPSTICGCQYKSASGSRGGPGVFDLFLYSPTTFLLPSCDLLVASPVTHSLLNLIWTCSSTTGSPRHKMSDNKGTSACVFTDYAPGVLLVPQYAHTIWLTLTGS